MSLYELYEIGKMILPFASARNIISRNGDNTGAVFLLISVQHTTYVWNFFLYLVFPILLG